MSRPRPPRTVNRRRFMTLAAQAGLLLLAGCDNLSRSEWFPSVMSRAESLTQRVQRWLTPRRAMAKEFTEADLSPVFPPNGTRMPETADYQALAQQAFADWRLEVTGLVARPRTYSLAELRALPGRTQITRHDCVEGWSAIGKWRGVPLSVILQDAQPLPAAQFVVFHCADLYDEDQPYYESVDLEDAHHPQTILAYEMNDQPLPIAHGAPLRLRVERQLGYKHAKYVMRIELVESFGSLYGGRGGYWEDKGYEWYAGI